MSWLHRIFLVVLLIAAVAVVSPAAAQTRRTAAPSVNTADIQRLQDLVYDAGGDVARLRAYDATRAADLQTELDDLREEVVYLKVKLRKQGTLSRTEYGEVRDRLEDVRSRARNANASLTPWPPATGTSGRDPWETRPRSGTIRPNEVPAGQELDVRLDRTLSSKDAEVEDRFTATTVVDLRNDDRVLIPAGSMLRGVVTSVDRATRIDRKGRMTVSFDQMTINGRAYPIRATLVQALESEGIRAEAGRIGAGAGVGAIIGGILGGFKGAIAGILIGAGGTVAATEGTDVDLPAGTILRIRIDSPVTVR